MRIITRAVGVFLVLTVQEVVCRQHEPDLASPFHGKFKTSVEPEEMVSCLKSGVNYLDTANYEPKDVAHFEYSWQWAYKKRFEDRCV